MPTPYDIAYLDLDESTEIPALMRCCPDIEARVYREGEYLMREGEESQEIFVILDGAYMVVQGPDLAKAAPTILATVMSDPTQPSVVGEMAYFGTQRRSATVRSSGRTLALCLKREHIEAIVEHFPGLLKLIFRQMAQRLLETNGMVQELQSRFALAPERRMVDAGDVLFRAGEAADKLFQIITGELLLEGPEGSRIVRADDLPQGFLDFGPFLRGGRHSATATVQSVAFVLVVGADRHEAIVRSYPRLALELVVKPV